MIVEQNMQIQKMEEEMEKLIKEKDLQLSTATTTSTVVTSTPTISIAAVYTTETDPTSQHLAKQLSKPMGHLSLKYIEI